MFLINLPLSLMRSIYNAHQEGYLVNIWWIVGSVVSLVGLIVVTRFQGGLPQLVLAMSGVPTLVSLRMRTMPSSTATHGWHLRPQR